MKKIVLFLLLPFISGCYSSEVLPSGASDYIVKIRGESFAQAKLNAIEKANKYCSESGVHFIEVSENEIMVSKNVFEYQLTFQCLRKEEYESRKLDMEKNKK